MDKLDLCQYILKNYPSCIEILHYTDGIFILRLRVAITDLLTDSNFTFSKVCSIKDLQSHNKNTIGKCYGISTW